MTSHDVVFKVRKLLKMKKVGHTGTLDPDVDGVLILCLGQATKLVDYFMNGEKKYHGEITLGIATETEDKEGAIIERVDVDSPISTKIIDETMETFVGTIQQIPPMYSAVKVNGKRLYEYARANETVERPIRNVEIHSFKRTSEPNYDSHEKTQIWEFTVDCGKGTYVRTLAYDLGKSLGYPAHMSDLSRLATGGFSIEDTMTMEELEEAINTNRVDSFIYPMSRIQSVMDYLVIDASQLFAVEHGQVVSDDFFNESIETETALFNQDNQLLAIYQPHPSKGGYLKPVKVFHNPEEDMNGNH